MAHKVLQGMEDRPEDMVFRHMQSVWESLYDVRDNLRCPRRILDDFHIRQHPASHIGQHPHCTATGHYCLE
jgi:hypothetical protein